MEKVQRKLARFLYLKEFSLPFVPTVVTEFVLGVVRADER